MKSIRHRLTSWQKVIRAHRISDYLLTAVHSRSQIVKRTRYWECFGWQLSILVLSFSLQALLQGVFLFVSCERFELYIDTSIVSYFALLCIIKRIMELISFRIIEFKQFLKCSSCTLQTHYFDIEIWRYRKIKCCIK